MRSFSHDRFREVLRGLRGGDVYERPLGRMATTTDNSWFTLLTQNTAPIHFIHAHAEKTEFGRPFVDSTFTVALVTGQSVTDVSQNVCQPGVGEIGLPAPVFEGDTIYSRSEVLEKRESRSRPNIGVVRMKTTGYNQNGVVVITFKHTLLVYRKGHAPEITRITPKIDNLREATPGTLKDATTGGRSRRG